MQYWTIWPATTAIIALLGFGFASEPEPDWTTQELTAKCRVPDQADGWHSKIFPMRKAVKGFPMLVGLRVTNTAHFRRSVRIVDLASAGADRELSFFVVGDDNQCRRFSRTSSAGLTPPSAFREKYPSSTIWIDSGNSVSMWFDIAHVMSYPPHLQVWPQDGANGIAEVFSPGEWEMVIRDEQLSVNWGPFRMEYRNPNPEEQLFLNRLGAPIEGSWFPELILRDEPLPNSDELPAETKEIVELVRVLRAAAKQDERARSFIPHRDASTPSPIQGLFDQIEYELLVSQGQLDGANKLSTKLDRGNLALVEKGKGLLNAYQQLYSAQDR
jgi:hypothetical protein